MKVLLGCLKLDGRADSAGVDGAGAISRPASSLPALTRNCSASIVVSIVANSSFIHWSPQCTGVLQRALEVNHSE